MLRNASSKARIAARNVVLHSRSPITLQRPSSLKWIEAPGFQSPLVSTSQRCLQRSLSCNSAAKSKFATSSGNSAANTAADSSPWPAPEHVAFRDASIGNGTGQSAAFGNDTIYAVSTGPGRAGIAIVRISGPSCLHVYNGLCPSKPTLKPRYASVRALLDPLNSSNILDDNAIVLHFPAPKTVTGEDVLELHIHGGPATVKAVLSAIPQCPSTHSIRYAEPGEFTRRAFQNNRLDLAQVEALSDMLSAETEQQRRAAIRGNSGKLGRTYEAWREQLLLARGEMEAMIDFSEDQHFEESGLELLERASAQVNEMIDSITAHQAAGELGELLKKGIRISLLGPPNAGKSSLMNQIVGREASIVSQEAGTTRDIVEVSLDIRGYLCTFADTAGLRSRVGEAGVIGHIEQEGIRRAKAKASESDVIIAMASVEPIGEGKWTINYDMEALAIAAEAAQSLVVVNKVDSVPQAVLEGLLTEFHEVLKGDTPVVTISCKDALSGSRKNPGNIHHFVDELATVFKDMTALPPEMEDLIGVTARQRQLLSKCMQHLTDFLEVAISDDGQEGDIVLAAEHLRSAANCLSRITGRGAAGDVEEVLGVVFEKFCVGK